MSTPLLLLSSLMLLNIPCFGRDIPEPGMGKEYSPFKQMSGHQGNFQWTCKEQSSEPNNTADFFDVRSSVKCEVNAHWKQRALDHLKIIQDLFGAQLLNAESTRPDLATYSAQLIRRRTLNPNNPLLDWGPKWTVLDKSQILFSGDSHKGRIVKTSQSLDTDHPFLKNMVNLDMSLEFQRVSNGEELTFEIFTRIDKKTHWTNRTAWKLWPAFSERLTQKATLSHLTRFAAAGIRLLSMETTLQPAPASARAESEALP